MTTPDLYRDFAYCALTQNITATATSVPVDEMGRLPSNADLSANDFWMTFESTYALGQFEIVRLVSKSAASGAGTLTIARAQQGSTAYAYNSGTILKHALTADMLRNLVKLAQQGQYRRFVDLGNFTVPGLGAVTASMAVLRRLISTSGGVGTTSGNFALTASLSGTVPASSSVTGTPVVARALSASVPAVAAVSGTLTVPANLSVTANGVGAVTGTLGVTVSTTTTETLQDPFGAQMFGA